MDVKKAIENWVNGQLNYFKGSNKNVLTFIANILYSRGIENPEIVRGIFAAGYCYYFALMLKDAFGGEICWHKGFSHIVWKDTRDDIVYDIDGVFYDYNEGDIVPISFLREELESFRHRGKDSILKEEMEAEAVLLGVSIKELEQLIYDTIPESEKVYPYSNTGDARRYFHYYKNHKESI